MREVVCLLLGFNTISADPFEGAFGLIRATERGLICPHYSID